MSIVEFKRRFKSSILNYFWVIAQPLLMILMYWFAFSAAGQSNNININGVSYNWLAWVLIGCFSWTYFADLIVSGPASVRTYLWMVKFYGIRPIIILIFTNISKLIVAGISIILAWIISIIINATDNNPNTVPFSAKSLEVLIYVVFMVLIMFAFSFAFCYINLVSKDFQNLLYILPTFLAWMSAVFLIPNPDGNQVVNIILQINPLYFVINGIRATMLGYGDLFHFDFYYQWYSLLSFFLFLLVFILIGVLLNTSKYRRFIMDVVV